MQMFRERAASMQSRPTPRPCQFCVSIFCGARAMSGMTFQGTAQDAVKRLERGIPRHQLHAYLNVFNSFDGHFMGTMANVSDRKSTRLNSSHVRISYAVFCLKE